MKIIIHTNVLCLVDCDRALIANNWNAIQVSKGAVTAFRQRSWAARCCHKRSQQWTDLRVTQRMSLLLIGCTVELSWYSTVLIFAYIRTPSLHSQMPCIPCPSQWLSQQLILTAKIQSLNPFPLNLLVIHHFVNCQSSSPSHSLPLWTPNQNYSWLISCS